MDIVGWLDTHEGFAIVLVTVAYTVVTLALVGATISLAREARRQRVEANVVAWAAPWELADGQYLAVHVENAGPAVARDVTFDWRLLRSVDAPSGHLAEPVMPIGFRRTVLPIRDPNSEGEGTTLAQLAAEGAPIEIDVSWRDGRRGRQTESVRTTSKEVQSAFFDSGALPRPSQLEVLGEMRKHLKRIADSKD